MDTSPPCSTKVAEATTAKTLPHATRVSRHLWAGGTAEDSQLSLQCLSKARTGLESALVLVMAQVRRVLLGPASTAMLGPLLATKTVPLLSVQCALPPCAHRQAGWSVHLIQRKQVHFASRRLVISVWALQPLSGADMQGPGRRGTCLLVCHTAH